MEDIMYCPTCKCEFQGWKDRCPVCRRPLVDGLISRPQTSLKSIPYDDLVNIVEKSGGQLEIELSTIEVGRERKLAFPFRGYGFAWAARMHGLFNNISVDLQTVEVGKDTDWGFPYQGYGFAWEKKLEGTVSGNKFILESDKVCREKKFLFPYRGHGYAWTQELSGECGNQLKVNLKTTEIGKDNGWFLFYFGLGYAWISRAIICVSLKS
jgi:hypothetical protein